MSTNNGNGSTGIWASLRAGQPRHLIAGHADHPMVLITECGIHRNIVCGSDPEHQRDSKQCRTCARIARARRRNSKEPTQ